MVEFALTLLLPLGMIVGMFAFVWVLFLRATLHNAVREGVRFAIVGDPGPLGLDDSIKGVIKEMSGGLLSDVELDEHVSVEFFDADCPSGLSCPIATADPNSVVRIAINCYSVGPFPNILWGSSSAGFPFELTVTASDKMQPFGGAVPRGTIAAPTACP